MFTNLSNGWKIAFQVGVVVAILGGAVALLLSMGLTKTSSNSHLVSFEVNAAGGYANITLEAGKVSITTPTTVTVPWTKKIRIKSGTEVYLTAANPSETGELSCRITLDNAPWKLETINAPKNGVACAGIVP